LSGDKNAPDASKSILIFSSHKDTELPFDVLIYVIFNLVHVGCQSVMPM